MRRFFLLLVITMVTSATFSQSQQGYVKTKGRLVYGKVVSGTRLSGVTVIVRGRNAVVSSSNGSFSLPISSNNFYLQNVLKQGYVLTDPDVLNRQYVQSKNPLTLVMETPDEQLEDKLEAMDKIRSTLQSQLSKSRAEIKLLKEQKKLDADEYRKRLQELASQQESNEQLVGEMADRYSKIDYDQLDEFNRRISECILNGRLQEADSLLKTKGDISFRTSELRRHQEANAQAEQDLKVKQKKLEKSIAQVQKDLEDLAQDCYSKFEIFKMQHENDSAAYYIEHRAGLDTMNIEWQIDAGYFAMHFLADFNKSLSFFQSTLDRVLKTRGEKSQDAFELNSRIARVYFEMGKYEEAISLNQKVIEQEREVYGESAPLLIDNLINIGLFYSEIGKNDDAEHYFMESLSNPFCSLEDSIHAYINLGGVYYTIDKCQQALQCYEVAIEQVSRMDGEDVDYTPSCYNGLSSVYWKLDEYSKSMDYLEKMIEIYKRVYGEKHPDVAIGYINKGHHLNQLGKYSDAIECFSDALAIDTLVYGDLHPVVASTYNNLGSSYSSLEKYDQAMAFYQKALGIYKSFWGVKHDKVASTLVNLGQIYEYTKEPVKALEYYNEALAILKETLGEQHGKVAICYNNIGNVYMEMKEFDKSEEMLKKALEIDLALFGENHTNVATDYNNFGRLNNERGDYAEAAKYMEKTFPILLKAYGENHPNVAISYYNVAVLHKKTGDYTKALELTQKAYDIISKILPEDHSVVKQFKAAIDEIKEKMSGQKK